MKKILFTLETVCSSHFNNIAYLLLDILTSYGFYGLLELEPYDTFSSCDKMLYFTVIFIGFWEMGFIHKFDSIRKKFGMIRM